MLPSCVCPPQFPALVLYPSYTLSKTCPVPVLYTVLHSSMYYSHTYTARPLHLSCYCPVPVLYLSVTFPRDARSGLEKFLQEEIIQGFREVT